MKGTILQPLYLPWMGYFEMIAASEVFVVFDHVPFAKKTWQSRNRVKGPNGEVMLTVPIVRQPRGTPISEIKVNYDSGDPFKDHWKTISLAYGKAEYFEENSKFLHEVYESRPSKLADLNESIITSVCQILGIKTRFVRSSKLDLHDEDLRGTERVVAVCKAAGITELYDGAAAKDFIDTGTFQKEGIGIRFQDYKHPTYRQLWGEFLPYMSAIDLLFNEGPMSMEFIERGAEGSK